MAGRSGRPDFNDEYGEAILIAKTEAHAEQLTEKYVYGEPESIYSKVSSQPVLRTYCLSLSASEFVKTTDQLVEFFNDTFFAHQYGDAKEIENKLLTTVQQLREWGFLKSEKQAEHEDFASADQLLAEEGQLEATTLGKRVSELYLDPLSAHELIDGMYKASTREPPFFAWLHLLCCSAEMRPLLRIKNMEYEDIQQFLKEQSRDLLVKEPSLYEPTYEQYLEAVKTAQMLNAWCDEQSEEYILETYNVRPGELRARVSIADWLLYSASELARILKFHHHIAPLAKTRTRLTYGAREELLALLKLKNVGRVRARTLYRNRIKTLQDLKDVNAQTLADLIGSKTAKNLKKQVGIDVDVKETSPRKRKGQMSLNAKRFQ
jgi:helicase